jgi:hypothetical protein
MDNEVVTKLQAEKMSLDQMLLNSMKEVHLVRTELNLANEKIRLLTLQLPRPECVPNSCNEPVGEDTNQEIV